MRGEVRGEVRGPGLGEGDCRDEGVECGGEGEERRREGARGEGARRVILSVCVGLGAKGGLLPLLACMPHHPAPPATPPYLRAERRLRTLAKGLGDVRLTLGKLVAQQADRLDVSRQGSE